jgi:MoxR-like ATPase
VAQATGRGWGPVNSASVRDPEEWAFFREARDGSTVLLPTPLTEYLAEPDMVICLDEINRIEPWLHSTLYPLLDDRRETIIHGQVLKVSPNTIFWITMNEGMQYTGTFQLDEALRQRAQIVLRLSHLEPDHECWVLEQAGAAHDLAEKVSELMHVLRNLQSPVLECDLSVRAAKNICRLVRCGLTLRESFEFEVLTMLGDNVQRDAAVSMVNTTLKEVLDA